MIETQPRVETSRSSPFERMQSFLKEHGEIDPGTKQLRIDRPAYSLTHLALWPFGFGRENIRRYFDLSITQTPTSGDIEILLNETGKEGKPKNVTTQIILTNPLNTTEEKAVIRPFNHISNVLRLSKDRWHEKKDQTGSFYTTDSDEEVEKIVDDFTRLQPIGGKATRKMVGSYDQKLGGYPKEPIISRRGFLRLMGLGAEAVVLDSLLSHIPYAPSLSKRFWEQLETATLGISPETLKKEIEETFQVELVGPSTGMVEVAYTDNRRYPTAEWDGPRLKALISVLAELPPHFYLPRIVEGQEHKVRFVLANPSLVTRIVETVGAVVGKEKLYGGWCACHSAENQLVVVRVEAANQTLPRAGETRGIFIHEITHALTTPEIDRYIRSIAEPIGLDSIPELRKAFSSIIILTSKGKPGEKVYPKNWQVYSEWGQDPTDPTQTIVVDEDKFTLGTRAWPSTEEDQGGRYFIYKDLTKQEPVVSKSRLIKINPEWWVTEAELQRFGEDFFSKQYQAYVAKIKDLEKYGGDISPLPSIPGIDVTNLSYGATNFKEFLSVAAEFYIRGVDRFVGIYEPFLGKERAEKLYDGMKREIFKGKEY